MEENKGIKKEPPEEEIPRCKMCGSSDIGYKIMLYPGINTVATVFSVLVLLTTGRQLGGTFLYMEDKKEGRYCKVCGSRKVESRWEAAQRDRRIYDFIYHRLIPAGVILLLILLYFIIRGILLLLK